MPGSQLLSQIRPGEAMRTPVRIGPSGSLLSYEHMFSSRRTSTLRRRTLGALGLLRSFLLLEDDYEVDWEVGQDELSEVDHPHRAALRARMLVDRPAHRRPGQLPQRSHVCLSPVDRPARLYQRRPARREGQRDAPRAFQGRVANSRRGEERPRAALWAARVSRKNRRRPTLPGPCGPSTIGAEGLNCSVRNGKRCFPLAKATGKRRETALPVLQNCTAPHNEYHSSLRGSKKSVKPSTH